MFFMRDESPSSCLALGQSGRTENSIQILSITVATSSGGLVNTRISDMSLLSRELSAWGERGGKERREEERERKKRLIEVSYPSVVLQCWQLAVQAMLDPNLSEHQKQ